MAPVLAVSWDVFGGGVRREKAEESVGADCNQKLIFRAVCRVGAHTLFSLALASVWL